MVSLFQQLPGKNKQKKNLKKFFIAVMNNFLFSGQQLPQLSHPKLLKRLLLHHQRLQLRLQPQQQQP